MPSAVGRESIPLYVLRPKTRRARRFMLANSTVGPGATGSLSKKGGEE